MYAVVSKIDLLDKKVSFQFQMVKYNLIQVYLSFRIDRLEILSDDEKNGWNCCFGLGVGNTKHSTKSRHIATSITSRKRAIQSWTAIGLSIDRKCGKRIGMVARENRWHDGSLEAGFTRIHTYRCVGDHQWIGSGRFILDICSSSKLHRHVLHTPNEGSTTEEPLNIIVGTFMGTLHPNEISKHESDIEVSLYCLIHFKIPL